MTSRSTHLPGLDVVRFPIPCSLIVSWLSRVDGVSAVSGASVVFRVSAVTPDDAPGVENVLVIMTYQVISNDTVPFKI